MVVIDDDSGIREAVGRMLSAAGFETVTFSSAEEFLGSGTLGRTSIMILDIQLPGLSGLDLQDRLRSQGTVLPAVFITGRDLPAHREAARRLGSPCLSKPFPGVALVDAIRSQLSAA